MCAFEVVRRIYLLLNTAVGHLKADASRRFPETPENTAKGASTAELYQLVQVEREIPKVPNFVRNDCAPSNLLTLRSDKFLSPLELPCTGSSSLTVPTKPGVPTHLPHD